MPPRNSANESKPSPGMVAATRALGARKGPPTEADAPPPSTFPMTPAARAAKAMSEKRYKSPY